MTLPSWPSEIPYVMKEGFALSNGEGRLRTQPETGPLRVRRRFSAVGRPVNIQLDLTRSQLAIFDDFYVNDISQGSLPFLMPDPTTSGWQLLTSEGLPLLTEEDIPILLEETWLCLWGDQLPSRSIRGMNFLVSFNLVVMPS